MLSRALKHSTRLLSCRAFSTNQPWKAMENYYNYDFTKKMEFIDHKVRFPLFRVMDLDGKILNPEYENLDKDFLLSALDTMASSRQMDVVYNNAQRQNRITFYMTGTMEEGANVGAVTGIKDSDILRSEERRVGKEC